MNDAELIAALKSALRQAILDTSRVVRRCIEVDSSGNSYELDWSDRVKEWAKLCDLDLEQCEPPWR